MVVDINKAIKTPPLVKVPFLLKTSKTQDKNVQLPEFVHLESCAKFRENAKKTKNPSNEKNLSSNSLLHKKA